MPGIRHKPVGSDLSQAEWEADDSHIVDSLNVGSVTGAQYGEVRATRVIAPRTQSILLPPQVWAATYGNPVLTIVGTVPDRFPVWAFPDSTQEYIATWTQIPFDYHSGQLAIVLNWSSVSGSGGTCLWEVRVTVFDAGEGLGKPVSWSTWWSLPGPASQVIRRDVQYFDLPGAAAGKLLRVTVGRLGFRPEDTMTGDAWLLNVEIRYTAVV